MKHETPEHVQMEQNSAHDTRWYVIHVRRRTLAEWLAWLIWLVALIILGEYTLSSIAEQEPQASVLAAAMCGSLLLAGIIVEVIKSIEARSDYADEETLDEDEAR